jgi:hypothetical protein
MQALIKNDTHEMRSATAIIKRKRRENGVFGCLAALY